MSSDPAEISAISNAFTSHWRMFGLYPGAELHEEDGVLWYRSPIRHLPYNAVIQTRVADGADPEKIVSRISGRFRELQLPFMWVVLPLDSPSGYEALLSRQGLDLVEEATGMSRSLATWSSSGRRFQAEVVPAGEEPAITDYELMIRTYWSVPEADRTTIQVLNRHWTGERSPGVRLVAYLEGKPVGKLFVNLGTLPDAAVYGVAVIPEARGRGIASEMLETALNWAKGVGGKPDGAAFKPHGAACLREIRLRAALRNPDLRDGVAVRNPPPLRVAGFLCRTDPEIIWKER